MGWRTLLSLAVFVYFGSGIFILSLPDPATLRDRDRWDTDRTRREFARLGAPFGADHEDVEAILWPLAAGTAAVVEVLRRPFEPAITYLGFFQRWRMFSVPKLKSARLAVDVLDEGAWRRVYASRSPEYDWRRSQFDHDRMRKLVARSVRSAKGKFWNDLSTWIARRAAKDFPNAEEVRVRSEEVAIPPVAEFVLGAEPTFETKAERSFRLAVYR